MNQQHDCHLKKYVYSLLMIIGFGMSPVAAGDHGFDYTQPAGTGSQHSLGEVFNDFYNGSPSSDMDDVIDEIRNLPDTDAIADAYSQIAPQSSLGSPIVTMATANQNNANLFNRIGQVRTGSGLAWSRYDASRLLASADNSLAYVAKDVSGWKPFFKAFGTWADRETDGSRAGYDYDLYGLSAGADKLIHENLMMGLNVGGSKANVNYDLPGTGTDVESVFTSLYGSWFGDDYHIDFTVGYGHSWYDSERGLHFGGVDRTAKSKHEGDVWSAAIEMGKNLGGEDLLLEPVVGFGYTAIHERGYQESGADSLNLKLGANTTESVYSKVGIRAAKELSIEDSPAVCVPEVRAFWLHDFSDRIEQSAAFATDGGSFTTQGHDPQRDSLNLGLGVNVYCQEGCRLFANYDWQISADFEAHGVEAGMQFSF